MRGDVLADSPTEEPGRHVIGRLEALPSEGVAHSGQHGFEPFQGSPDLAAQGNPSLVCIGQPIGQDFIIVLSSIGQPGRITIGLQEVQDFLPPLPKFLPQQECPRVVGWDQELEGKVRRFMGQGRLIRPSQEEVDHSSGTFPIDSSLPDHVWAKVADEVYRIGVNSQEVTGLGP